MWELQPQRSRRGLVPLGAGKVARAVEEEAGVGSLGPGERRDTQCSATAPRRFARGRESVALSDTSG